MPLRLQDGTAIRLRPTSRSEGQEGVEATVTNRRIGGAGVIRLIRAYLNSGIMSDGVVQERYQGTAQGGPLSPLLANVLLDEVDKELERRGHCFVRYADDTNVYVRSRRAGERVMARCCAACTAS
jgi:retron-type reverse transcriptase